MPIELKGSDKLKFTGARITKTQKLFLPMPKDGKDQEGAEILELRLVLDSVIQKSKYSRYDWDKIIGKVGGVERFYGGYILLVVGYFTRIDYMAEFISKLFLVKQSNKTFHQKFFKKNKRGCLQNCEDIFE